MGFEPTRAEHNGLAVHRLNHSATSSARAAPYTAYLMVESRDSEQQTERAHSTKLSMTIRNGIFRAHRDPRGGGARFERHREFYAQAWRNG